MRLLSAFFCFLSVYYAAEENNSAQKTQIRRISPTRISTKDQTSSSGSPPGLTSASPPPSPGPIGAFQPRRKLSSEKDRILVVQRTPPSEDKLITGFFKTGENKDVLHVRQIKNNVTNKPHLVAKISPKKHAFLVPREKSSPNEDSSAIFSIINGVFERPPVNDKFHGLFGAPSDRSLKKEKETAIGFFEESKGKGKEKLSEKVTKFARKDALSHRKLTVKNSLNVLSSKSYLHHANDNILAYCPGIQEYFNNGAIQTKSPLDMYKVIDKIAIGGFGAVYKVSHGSRVYAMKIVPTYSEVYNQRSLTKSAFTEAKVFIKLAEYYAHLCRIIPGEFPYPFVLSHEIFYYRRHFVFIMDFLDGAPLQKAKVSDKELRGLCEQALIGFDILAHLNIVHHDIKHDNLIYDKRTKTLKIIDYGSAVILLSNKNSDEPFYIDAQGVPEMAPPESFLHTRQPSTARDLRTFDVYSFATMLRMLYGNRDSSDAKRIVELFSSCVSINSWMRPSPGLLLETLRREELSR